MNPMVFFITLVFATLVTAIPVFTNDIAMRCVGEYVFLELRSTTFAFRL